MTVFDASEQRRRTCLPVPGLSLRSLTREGTSTFPTTLSTWLSGGRGHDDPRALAEADLRRGDRIDQQEPLDKDALRDHVVLVDFWTLTCINWLRTEPYVRAWSRAYRDDGLIVVGVHTPEFSFEHDLERVRQATKEMAIDYPVAQDNDYAVWRAFDNHYWPALYPLDV